MNELIKITEENGKQTVNARDLYIFLESKQEFTHWIKQRINRGRFKIISDYVLLDKIVEQNGSGGHNKIEYHLSIGMAKDIGMLENNIKGDEIRKYFRNCEQELLLVQQPKTQSDKFSQVASISKSMIDIARSFGLEGNQALLSANKAVVAITGENPLELLGHTFLINEDQQRLLTPTEIGKSLNPPTSGMKVNIILGELDFQHKEGKYWLQTFEGRKHCTLLDTGKKRSDGTPVQQVKWKESVLDLLSKV